MDSVAQMSAASAPIASVGGDTVITLFIVVVSAIAVIAILAAFVFYTKSISDKQLEKLLDYHQKKEGVQGNVIWHYANIVGTHSLRRNEFWSATIQIIGSIVVVAILSALLIYKVISAEAALPIISAVSGFGLSRASNLNQSDTTKSEK